MSSLAQEIKQAIDLEKLRREAAQILKPDEWADVQKVVQDHQAQRRFAKRAYEIDYDDRIAMARTRLINQAGAKDRHFKPRWMGGDRFNKDAINRQARRVVHHSYLNEQVSIDRDETKELTQLLEASEHTRAAREKPRRDFERATDRRTGMDRRMPQRTRKRSIS